jgi:hypothetical protein
MVSKILTTVIEHHVLFALQVEKEAHVLASEALPHSI